MASADSVRVQDIGRIKKCLYDNFQGFTVDSTYQTLTTNVVFHTWVAQRGTGIPDGIMPYENIHGKGHLDYVSKIRAQAAAFEDQMIPVMVVYARVGLPETEEAKMLDRFKEENNIVTLCLEDVPNAVPPDSYKRFYAATIDLTFHLPLAVIKHASGVLRALRAKATVENKRGYVMRLDNNNGNAIMYATMDLVFRKNEVPPEVIAKNGMCSWPEPSGLFTLTALLHGDIEDRDLKRVIRDHAHVFTGGSDGEPGAGDPDRIASYMLSGKAFETHARVIKALGYYSWDTSVCNGHNAMMLVAYSSTPTFKRIVDDDCASVDLHIDPKLTIRGDEETLKVMDHGDEGGDLTDPLFKENHTLIYLQLLPYMYHTKDSVWHASQL